MTTQPLSPLTMLLSRHTRRRDFITLLGSAAAQQRRLHQRRGPIAEPGARRGDIGDPGGVRQLEFADDGERRGTRFRPQVTDVGGAEAQPRAQEGLTPVIITL